MKPLDWLRRQRKPKPATGGLIKPTGVLPLGEPGPAPFTIPTQRLNLDDAPWPPQRITFTAPAELTTEQIEQLLADTGRAMAAEARFHASGRPIDCGCMPRYSECRCLRPET